MIEAEQFIREARGHGFSLYAGVPCSYLKPFINYVIDADDLRYIGAANEGDAVAVAAGAELAGGRAVAMFQNSGLGNAVNPLTSLTHTFRIPVLLITTLRGEPGGAPDEPQHELMGTITTGMLAMMGIDWAFFPREPEAIAPALATAVASMDRTRRPYAFVMQKGSVASRSLERGPDTRAPGAAVPSSTTAVATRADMLRAAQAVLRDSDAVVATTGYTGRELYACGDRPNQLYMVGSMGCAVSLGLGIATARPERRVVVLDGDGAALMRLGALATVGYERPPNLVHVLLDNGIHESTGGQATVSRSIDFAAIAAAVGYPEVRRATTPDALAAALEQSGSGLCMIHAPIVPGIEDSLPRPTITPPEVAERFRRSLAEPPA